MLHHHPDVSHLHLLVLLIDIDSLLIVGHSLRHHLGRIGIDLDACEEFLDLILHMVHIDITHYDDSLIIRTIPLLIVGTQCLGLEAVDDRHQTDGQTLAILRTRIGLRQGALQHALRGTLTQAPLVVNDVTLLIDLLGLECQAVRPVLQDEQTRVEGGSPLGGNVADTIDCLVDRGIGVQVAAELNTQRTAELDNAITLEVL